MILAAAVVSLLISERGYQCHSKVSCPQREEIRAAALEYESERLTEVQKIWEQSQKADEIIIGPHMFILDRVENIQCVNETEDEKWASCSFQIFWGKNGYRQSFIADLELSEEKWKIVDAKSIVEKLKDD